MTRLECHQTVADAKLENDDVAGKGDAESGRSSSSKKTEFAQFATDGAGRRDYRVVDVVTNGKCDHAQK